MNYLRKIENAKPFYLLVGCSMTYFLIKGVQYAFIGSYVPLVFIATILSIFIWSFSWNQKQHYGAVKMWARIIILWALIRIVLSIILQFDHKLTESHLREQFGIFQVGISLVMLGIGIALFINLKRIKKKGLKT